MANTDVTKADVTFDYTVAQTITIKNVIKECESRACDAGTPIQKVQKLYKEIEGKPCMRWDYVFNENGEFAKGYRDENGAIVISAPTATTPEKTEDSESGEVKAASETPDTSTTTTPDLDFVVVVYERFRNTSRDVPAYRCANKKITLKPGESMQFVSDKKDEIVFYEKVRDAFAGELEVDIKPVATTGA